MSKYGQRGRRVTASRLLIASIVVVVAALGGLPALGQSQPVPRNLAQDERTRALDALFRGLKGARGDEEAEVLVARIWEVWTRSGRADVDSLIEEGIAFLSVRQLGAAYDSFTKAIEAEPGFAEAWNKRATVLYLLHQHEQSLSDIEKVLALEPRHFGALAGRGMIHAQAGRWKEALDAYYQALSVNPFLKERAIIIPELERRSGEKPL
jgi:tetratricopeptide (TPR) repeat protein